MPQKKTKYEDLAGVLRNKILPLSSGTRLPSVRGLMKRYKVSLQTVNAAIGILQKEKLVVARQGSGLYVSEHRPVKLIVLHRTRHPSSFDDAKEASLRRAIHAKGWYLDTRRHEVVDDEIGASLVPEPVASAHIVMQDVAHLQPSLIAQLQTQNVPLLIFGRESEDSSLDYVTGSEQAIFSMLVKHLRSLGHRHFALLVNEPAVYLEIKTRIQAFLELLELLDLPPGLVIDCGTAPGESGSQAARSGLKTYIDRMKGKRLPFTALITCSSVGGYGALRAFHECHVAIPSQCSVASHGAEMENELSIPSLTDAGTPDHLWGTSVAGLLQQRFAGDPTPHLGYKLPVELTVRESTAPPPRKVGAKRIARTKAKIKAGV